MTEKDIEIWNECCEELSSECKQEADVLLRHVTKKLKEHTEEYNQNRDVGVNSGRGVSGVGKTGAKELIIALIKAGYL
jgi:hypothetical protein